VTDGKGRHERALRNYSKIKSTGNVRYVLIENGIEYSTDLFVFRVFFSFRNMSFE